MKSLLQPWINNEIGINLERALHIEGATLSSVQNEYFTVTDARGYSHHFPYSSVLQIIEHEGGIEVGGLFQHKKRFPLVIKITHLPEFTPV